MEKGWIFVDGVSWPVRTFRIRYCVLLAFLAIRNSLCRENWSEKLNEGSNSTKLVERARFRAYGLGLVEEVLFEVISYRREP